MKPRLIVASLLPPDVVARARADFAAVVAEGSNDMTLREVLAALAEHETEALLLTTTLKLDAAAIARLPALLKIAATSSVGFDHIDVAAARARGLIVTNTPDVLNEATAELAFMLVLNACRRAHEYDRIMRAGWRERFGQGDMLGLEVSGRTLGILGMGRIGRAVAQRARDFGMTVLYSNRTRLAPELEQGARFFPDFRAMLPHCQILTVHAPAGPATDSVMNRETFGLLPKGAVFVNTARGALVDEDALYDGADTGPSVRRRASTCSATSRTTTCVSPLCRTSS